MFCFVRSSGWCRKRLANTVFGVIIGTGTGGGIVNKKIVQGRNQIGGEWGHTSLPNQTDDEKKYALKDCLDCGLEVVV